MEEEVDYVIFKNKSIVSMSDYDKDAKLLDK